MKLTRLQFLASLIGTGVAKPVAVTTVAWNNAENKPDPLYEKSIHINHQTLVAEFNRLNPSIYTPYGKEF